MAKLSLTCSSCDGSHPDVELKELRGTPPALATHWYECPRTKDPVWVTIRTVKGQHELLATEVMERLSIAQGGPNLVLVFHFDPEKRDDLMMHWVPSNFETGHLSTVLDLVKRKIMQDVGAPEGGPMRIAVPPADEDEPFARLFGARGNGG